MVMGEIWPFTPITVFGLQVGVWPCRRAWAWGLFRVQVRGLQVLTEASIFKLLFPHSDMENFKGDK